MTTTTRSLLILASLLPALFLSAATARAQTAVSYRFLEVLDTGGRPVEGATVEAIGGPRGPRQTDARGAVRELPVFVGDYNTRRFKVSKPGYLTYEGNELFDASIYGELFESIPHQPGHDTPIKVVLLKAPATAAEREAVEAELRRRELLVAVKAGDAATAEKLLRAGVSPDATDFNGIPAVLFAAANGDAAMIKILLAAGADVRNKGRPGRKALLHYVSQTRRRPVDVGAVRSLIKAGADVKAANKYGETVLVLARRSGSAEVVKLLEEAGARL